MGTPVERAGPHSWLRGSTIAPEGMLGYRVAPHVDGCETQPLLLCTGGQGSSLSPSTTGQESFWRGTGLTHLRPHAGYGKEVATLEWAQYAITPCDPSICDAWLL